MAAVLRLVATVIDLADGDPTKGNLSSGRRWRCDRLPRALPDGPGPAGLADDFAQAVAMAACGRPPLPSRCDLLHVRSRDSRWGAAARRDRPA